MTLTRQLLAPLVLCFTLPCVAGVAQPAISPLPLKPLTIAVNSAPRTLDAATATDAAGARLLQLTHPALLGWNDKYEPVGLVAESCAQTQPTVVTCTLPKGRTFTDGAPLTAQALAQWMGQLQANTLSPFTQLKDVKVVAMDVRTLTFTLPSASLSFMGALTEIPLANPKDTTVGGGPYRIAGTDTLGAVTLATSRTDIPALTFVPLADATTRLLKLKKGEVDGVFNDVAPQLVGWAQAQGFPVVAVLGTSYSYLSLNLTGPVLGKAEVREALALGLNRPALRRFLLGDLATPATTLLPPGHPAAWEAKEEPHDPFTAENLLDDAGYLRGPDNTRLTLTLLTSTDPFSQRVSQALQAQWQEMGVQVVLRPMEWASFYDAVKKGNFDMAMLAWTGEQQPSFYYHAFASSQVPPVGLNRGRLKDAGVDALTQQVMAAPTVEAQRAATVAVQQKLAEVRPYLPLYRRHQVLITGKDVSGCRMAASGAYTGLASCRKR